MPCSTLVKYYVKFLGIALVAVLLKLHKYTKLSQKYEMDAF